MCLDVSGSSILELRGKFLLENFHISQFRRRIPAERRFLMRAHLKETNLYEENVVPYVHKIVPIEELVGVVAFGRLCVRLGANGWI